MKASLNQILFRIHSWLGLFNGIWLLILGITGSLLVFTLELDKWANRDLLTVKPQTHKLSYDSLYHIVRKAEPKAMGVNIFRFANEKTDCVSFKIYLQDETKPMYQWFQTHFMDIDPYSGKILRWGSSENIGDSFLFWSGEFHWNLQFGNYGTLIITIAGILLLVNIVTGIVIYRKHFLRALIFKAPVLWKNWRTGTSGLHRYIGVWSLLLNILIFYSGLQMTWGSLSKEYYKKPDALSYNMGRYTSIDAMMLQTQKIFPGFIPHYFYIPFSKNIIDGQDLSSASEMGEIPGTPSIIPLSQSSVNFNINTGKILSQINANEELRKQRSLWDKFNYIAFSFHAGTFLGLTSRILYVFAGLAPAFLSISGFGLWIRRKKLVRKGKTTSYQI